MQKFAKIISNERKTLKFGSFHAIIAKNGTNIEICKSSYNGKAY